MSGTQLPVGGSAGSAGSVGQVEFDFGPPPSADELGPDILFADIENELQDPALQLNETPPRAWTEGGVIENVKRAVVQAVRESLQRTTLGLGQSDNMKFHIDIEYPTEITEYPGIWVQFSMDNLSRAGLAMSRTTKDENGNWIEIRQWMFDGTITLSIAALSSKERDRAADAIIAQLAFSRTTDLAIRNPSIDTKQMRGLWDALLESPYIAISLGTDNIRSGGQTVTAGVPWAQNVLLYEDSYAITCNGQFNIAYRHDGLYELSKINVNAGFMTSIPMEVKAWGPWVIPDAQQEVGQTHPPPDGEGGMLI